MAQLASSAPTLTDHGAQLFARVLADHEIVALRDEAYAGRTIRGGRRIYRAGALLYDLLSRSGAIGAVAARFLGDEVKPVRVLMFDKTPQSNWSVAWHQDRAITVSERRDAPGFGPWSVKDGHAHVAPPMEVLDRMVTVRAHIDDCGLDNAPLLAALGSHRLGRVGASQAEGVALEHQVLTCMARSGDVWVYSTPILHASEPSRSSGHRRVLQVDYAGFDLPCGLHWLGLELCEDVRTR
jgi:hypothetical protein